MLHEGSGLLMNINDRVIGKSSMQIQVFIKTLCFPGGLQDHVDHVEHMLKHGAPL